MSSLGKMGTKAAEMGGKAAEMGGKAMKAMPSMEQVAGAIDTGT